MSNPVLDSLKRNMRVALRESNLDDAENILSRLRKEDPLAVETRGFELELHLKRNRYEEAHELARQLRRLFPSSERILTLAGIAAYRLRRYQEAEACFRESAGIKPRWQTRQWLGKTLTQLGKYDEAEALLISVRESNHDVLLDLCWLHERRNDLDAALKVCEEFLEANPGNHYAAEQRIRIKAKMLEPEALIEEVSALQEVGESVSDALLPEFIQGLFDTSQGPRARDEIMSRFQTMDGNLAIRVAWVCYRASAFDLACALFLSRFELNIDNYKSLSVLETAASRCNRLAQVIETYRKHAPHAPHLYGRLKSLSKRYEEHPHR